MPADLARVLGDTRLAELPKRVRRLAGLPYLAREDFLCDLPAAEAERLARLSRNARGAGPAPIVVLGVMPRSGTNFLHDLISLHPDVHADPGRLYEFPLLQVARGAEALMGDFVARFPRNAEVLGRRDLLAMLAGAWLGELQREAGPRRMLLKCPHVENLALAPHVYAGAKILLCLRDGRDVVDSWLGTFPRWSPRRKTFGQLAREWRLSAEAILRFAERGPLAHPDVAVVRYEDLQGDPEPELRRVLAHAGLDAAAYDFATAAALPVRGSSRAGGSDHERWQPQARKADFNPVRRWAGWPPARLARFDRIAGDLLREAGYEPSA